MKEKYKFKAYRKYFVKIIILHKASFRLMIMIMVMIIFPILAITDWLWQICISSSPKLHLDVPKSRLELIFLFRFQQRSVHKIPPRRCSILISNVLWNAYELLTFFYARKEFDIETKMGSHTSLFHSFSRKFWTLTGATCAWAPILWTQKYNRSKIQIKSFKNDLFQKQHITTIFGQNTRAALLRTIS